MHQLKDRQGYLPPQGGWGGGVGGSVNLARVHAVDSCSVNWLGA